MLPGIAKEAITRVRPALVEDGHGNTAPNWAAASTLRINGCFVQPGPSREDLINRDGVLTIYTVYAPPSTDVKAGDAVEVHGGRYQVDGEPLRWGSGSLAHTVIALTRWEG